MRRSSKRPEGVQSHQGRHGTLPTKLQLTDRILEEHPAGQLRPGMVTGFEEPR